jgi:hypothetical protein
MIFDEKKNATEIYSSPIQPQNTAESIPGMQPKHRSAYPQIAGICLLLAGIIALISGGFMIMLTPSIPGLFSSLETSSPQSMPYNYSSLGYTPEFIQSMILLCGVIIIILAIFPLLGGIMALKRKMWSLALIGSILGLFTVGILFISSILSFIALILIALSRKEFEQGQKPPEYS